MKTFPQAPYFDDFSADNNFLKILFQPGYAVQTRELNQAQTILQNQITSFGNHIFKEGAMVIPGHISYEQKVDCIKLQSTNSTNTKIATFLNSFIGKTIIGTVSGITAYVIHAEVETDTDANTLYIRYIQSNGSNGTFIDNETIRTSDSVPLTANTAVSSTVNKGSLVMLQAGIYYTKGYFVLVQAKTISLDKYTTTPSYNVGLRITENILTAEDDRTLNDNAIGEYNYNAPGANRYKIATNLEKISLTATDTTNFLTLLTVENGVLENIVSKTDYSELEKTLARRTYDESGDYSVSPATLDIRHNRDNNRGTWKNNTVYEIGDLITYSGNTYRCSSISTGISGSTAPTYAADYTYFSDSGVVWQYTTTPIYNRGIYNPNTNALADSKKISLGLVGGKFYVKGYELEKHATSYVTLDKARDFQNSSNVVMTPTVGYYVKVTNLYSTPSVAMPIISLYDNFTATAGTLSGNVVGTARVRHIESDDNTPGNASTAVFKVFLFDVQMNVGKTFANDVRQLYKAGTPNFTADIVPTWTKITGTATVPSTNTITGYNTIFSTELRVNDYISLDALTAIKVATIPNTSSITGIISTVNTIPRNIYIQSATIYESGNVASYFYLPNSYVRSVRNIDDITVNTQYYITRKYEGQTGSSITLSTAGETFAPTTNISNYLIINNSNNLSISGASLSVDATGKILSGISGWTTSYTLYATIVKTAKEKLKTSVLGTKTTTTQVEVQSSVISLGVADVYNIVNIMVYPASYNPISGAGIDITDNYILDYGIRDTHYGLSSIVLKSGYFPPNGAIRIKYEYFSHGDGDYFSIDSYKNVIPYDTIPYDQRDILDFRPVLKSDGTFEGTNNGIVKRGYNITADYSYYLSRVDLLSIDTTGKYFVTTGIPSLTPKVPNVDSQGMLLYTFDMNPYTIDVSSNSIDVTMQDNKRYTMRDIGSLEKRIDNLEYYTSLCLLEQETKALSVPDSKGLERYKNGFLVDNFSDHGIGDVDSLDYRCSIDQEKNELRPEHNTKNIKLVEFYTTNEQRNSAGYAITGDLITLPYTHKVFIDQPIASRVSNINPFAVFTFIGSTEFTPASDDWFETTRLPNKIVQKEGNYELTKKILQSSGVLGTVWGSWKTTWVGIEKPDVTIVKGKAHGIVAKFDDGSTSTIKNLGFTDTVADKKWPFKKADLQLQTKITTDSVRSGVRTSVTAKFDNEVIDDKVVSTSIIPYMRARNIVFLARGLKPSALFYPFFDNINVSAYIVPASSITITTILGFTSIFDYNTNVGSNGAEVARRISGQVNDSLTKGDIITGSISNATAVVTLQENRNDGTIILKVVNIIGAFVANDIIVGSISKARGSIKTIETKALGDTLLSNINGDITGIFNVPNTDSIRFTTGEKEFVLTTSSLNGSDFNSIVRSNFHASGILQTKQQTVESVRNATVATERVSGSKTTFTTGKTTVNTWYDPLAQSFLINSKGGAFLSKVDVYFSAKDSTIPVRMHIREMVNGSPGKVILPFSECILSSNDVNISTRTVIGNDGNKYQAPDTPTTFVFPSPVYVQDNTEYCVVLMSNSDQYYVWTAYAKDKKIDADGTIDRQPYMGVLFKSQNSSTWTAEQNEDLKFTIYRSQFATNVTAGVIFNNTVLNPDILTINPIQTTSGTTKVRIYHYNHGMVSGDTVILSGITAAINGVPFTEFTTLTGKTISNVDVDSYMIDVTTSPSSSGFGGGSSVTATANIKYDVLNTNMNHMDFPDTSLGFNVRSTTYSSNILDSYPSDIILGKDMIFTSTRIIASPINQVNKLNNKTSFELLANISSSNDSISPVIDTSRCSMVAVSNRINNIDKSYNINPFDIRIVSTTKAFNTIVVNTNSISATNSTRLELLTIIPGKSIYITGFGANTAFNGLPILVKSIVDDGTTITLYLDVIFAAETTPTLTIKVGDYFVSEIVPVNSSSIASYVTKIVTLENTSKSFKILYSYNKPAECFIDIYYKLADTASIGNLINTTYTLLNPSTTMVSTSNYNTFYDMAYDATVSPFTAIVVKIVMRSTTSAKVPRLKDFRLIALA